MLEVPRWRGWQNRARISSAFCGGEQETRELTISHRWANLRLMLAKRGTYVVQTRDSIDAMPEVRIYGAVPLFPAFVTRSAWAWDAFGSLATRCGRCVGVLLYTSASRLRRGRAA